jgi:hypothetical protein
LMLSTDAPIGSNPVKVAWLMSTQSSRRKSSAVSVWTSPALAGRDSVPINPSGAPVEKEKGLADARGGSRTKASIVKPKTSLAAVAAFFLIKLGLAAVEVRRFTPWVRS